MSLSFLQTVRARWIFDVVYWAGECAIADNVLPDALFRRPEFVQQLHGYAIRMDMTL